MKTKVLVIGGGPAGATVSTLLSKNNIEVILVEKEKFPRYHVGESLLPSLIPIANLLEIGDELEKYNFIKKPGAYLEWGDEIWSLIFGELSESTSYSYQVDRASFDNILLENAKKSGVKVFEKTKVIDVKLTDNGRPYQANVIQEENDILIEFDYVVDASGRNSILQKYVKNKRIFHDVFKNTALWSYWKNFDISGFGEEGSIRVFSIEEGWVWFIPIEKNLISVGVIVHNEKFQEDKKLNTKDDLYRKYLFQHDNIDKILNNALCDEEIHIESDYSYYADKFAGNGYFSIGDAACFLDPLLSSGVHLATFSGMLAAATITSIINNDITEDQGVIFFEKAYKQSYLRFMVFISAFYDIRKGQKSYFTEAQKLSNNNYDKNSIKDAFISLVSGVEDLTDIEKIQTTDILKQVKSKLQENIDIRFNKDKIDRNDKQVKDNVEFFDAIEGFMATSVQNSIDGLYVSFEPTLAISHI